MTTKEKIMSIALITAIIIAVIFYFKNVMLQSQTVTLQEDFETLHSDYDSLQSLHYVLLDSLEKQSEILKEKDRQQQREKQKIRNEYEKSKISIDNLSFDDQLNLFTKNLSKEGINK